MFRYIYTVAVVVNVLYIFFSELITLYSRIADKWDSHVTDIVA